MRERTRVREARPRVPASDDSFHDREVATPSLEPAVRRAIGSGGEPLRDETRAAVEPYLGFDFSRVRIHATDEAALAADAVDAAAFTLGSSVVFGAGRYAPDTTGGQRLVAHELAHVAQQASGAPAGRPIAPGLALGARDDPYERAAEELAERATHAPGGAMPTGGARSALPPNAGSFAGGVIQRWGESEHKRFGDTGAGGRSYEFGDGGGVSEVRVSRGAEPKGQIPFELTQGDLNLLGDWFDLRDTVTLPVLGLALPNPDSLFLLAKIPSDNPGWNVGTRDEILYALKKNIPNDPRFSKDSTPEQPDGGVWSDIVFSDEVKDKVNSRYLRLASGNREHFPSPNAPVAPGETPAGDSYRDWHEDALWRAYLAGQAKQEIGEPLAREAAAQHFLTDYFSAGHIRTPIQAIRDYWAGVYPLFFSNLKKKIAMDVARGINDEFDPAGIFGTINKIYDTSLGTVEEVTKSMPPFTFGDVVGRVVHDMDNVSGLAVTNDFGDRWYTYGDSHLDTPNLANRTLEMASKAVKLGTEEIEYAFRLGSAGATGTSRDALLADVRSRAAGMAFTGDARYAAELVVPRMDPAVDNSVQNWRAASVDDLWHMPVRTDLPKTFGEAVAENLDHGEIGNQLREVKIDEEQIAPTNPFVKGMGTIVHPKKAYHEWFLQPLLEQPLVGLKGIIDFNPSEHQVWFNEDDIVREELEGFEARPGMTDDEMKGFTTNQRADRITALIEGTFNYVDEDDGELVIRLFSTAPAGQRTQIYRQVEGHPWTGDWIEGVFTSDDEIYNSLSGSQLDRLRDIINGT